MSLLSLTRIIGFNTQLLVQLLCKLKGGTTIARYLASFLNRHIFNGCWLAKDMDRVAFSLDVHSELDWQILAYGGFDLPLLALLKSVMEKGSVFIDIGANIGCISLPISRFVGTSGRVLSFEADPDIFQCLQKNALLNSFPNWRGFNIALGSAPGYLTFHRAASIGSFGNAVGSLYENAWHAGGSSFDVRVETLDRSLDMGSINRVDVIKIDVEGAELDVLRGAYHTISKFRPILCIEVCEHTYMSAGWSPQTLFDMLSPFGYTFEALDDSPLGRTRPLQGPDDRNYLTIVAQVG